MTGKKNSGKERETDMFCCEGLRILIGGGREGFSTFVFFLCIVATAAKHFVLHFTCLKGTLSIKF